MRTAGISMVCAAAALAGITPLAAQPIGSEFRVNRFTVGEQSYPTTGLDADGDFVVLWHSAAQDGDGLGIFGRKFNSNGAALNVEFQVNVYTTGDQRLPAVAMAADGDFVATWESNGQDGAGFGIFGRRFDSGGSAKAAEFQVNSATASSQRNGAVAIDDAGGFVVAYQSENTFELHARRFDPAGTGLGSEFQVNTSVAGVQASPSIGMNDVGVFVVAWQSMEDGADVRARRFDSGGTAQGSDFAVNLYTTDYQTFPAVGVAADGGFVVAWQSKDQDGDGYGVFGRRFDPSGAGLGDEFQVDTHTLAMQDSPAVAVHDSGAFVVTWDASSPSVFEAFARTFDSDGVPEGPEFQVNTYTPSTQLRPSVSADQSGDFVVSWMSSFQDGSSGGVFARRHTSPFALDVDGNGVFEALADGLLLLRYGFGFRGATLINGAVGAGCQRCDAPSIEAHVVSLLD